MTPAQALVVARLIYHAQRYASNPAAGRRLPLEDAIRAAKRLPNPGCPDCNGDGQRPGEAGPCGCSVMDVLEDK